MIETLSAADVDAGKDHPFVRELVKEIREMMAGHQIDIEQRGRCDRDDGPLRHTIGETAGLRWVLKKIANAKGKDDE